MASANEKRGTLSRPELREILRANVEAFRGEPDFYEYLTELIIYLMEYEYAWSADQDPDNPSFPPTRNPGSTRHRFEFIQPINLNSFAARKDVEVCRMCGADLQGRMVCPNCLSRNRKK